MTTPMKIDFVSDVSCPWCAIGLHSLEQALQCLGNEVDARIHFQPFELNPQMGREGQNLTEHLAEKYGVTPEQLARMHETIRERGQEVGFVFDMDKRDRIYNTFDAHRLLHWAAEEGRERELEHALFKAYFTDGENLSLHEVLVRLASEAGLDPKRAQEIVASNTFAQETREQQRFYLDQGIHSVPAVIVNDRYVIQGGQPVEVFEQALRQIATE